MTLEQLKKETEKKLGKKTIFGEGPSNAKVVMVAERPGKTELKLKRNFVGRAGKFLDKTLEDNKISRKKLYITSVIKTSGRITRKEVDKNKPVLEKEINIVKPKVIILLGSLALKTVLNKGPISKYHGKIIRKDGIIYVPMFHPAAAMRFPKVKKKFRKDFKKISKTIR